MSTIPQFLTGSPSLADGFNGARDASILESYADWKSGDPVPAKVHVQNVAKTRDLLKRAGFERVRRGEFYQVKVVVDDFNRLQLAPETKTFRKWKKKEEEAKN